MNIFVTGILGMLGNDVQIEALHRGHQVYGCGRGKFVGMNYLPVDLSTNCHWLLINYFREHRIDCVIHCAAYTDVVNAEKEHSDALRGNMVATAEVAEAAAKCNIPMIYISTDYIYNVKHDFPIQEGESKFMPETPSTYYGYTKLLGEQMVQHCLDNYYIVRTSWLFGSNGKNFVNTMLELDKKNKPIKVVNDQIGRPTYTKDLAVKLIDMAETNKYGTYNVTNSGPYVSWYDFAKFILPLRGNIQPVSTALYGGSVPRPLNSRLYCDKFHKAGFNRMPDWRLAVCRYIGGNNVF